MKLHPMSIAALALAGALVLPLAASAATTTASPAARHVARREQRQQVRIHQGVRRGQLTRGEARRLRGHQAHLRHMERRAARDGVLSRGERQRIERAQDRQSRRLGRLRHNRVRRAAN